jgi:phospholipid-translocating ATPase
VFGAATGKIAFLPLAFIITVTAIKDGIEDYRRALVDEEVNSSAATKLGAWRNVNQPTDSRSWFAKLFGLNKPGKVTRGVRKLREKDAGEGMRVVLKREGDERDSTSVNESSVSLSGHHHIMGAGGRRLDDIQSIDSHSYPPATFSDVTSKTSLSSSPSKPEMDDLGAWNRGTMSTYQQSTHSQSTLGVIDLNRRPMGSARWERTLWKKLEVGDVVLLRDDDQVPADIVVLSTSDPDGMCYVETKNLDGETNLKPRKAVRGTSGIKSEEDVERSSFYLDSEGPHANLYLYHGVLHYKDPLTGDEKQEVLSSNELLLRGCAIRNTAWVIGLVVFTGPDTKIMLNGGDTPSKRSKIEKETNFNVIVNFVVLLAMCIIAAICSGLQQTRTETSEDFFEAGSEPTGSAVVNSIVTFACVPFAVSFVHPPDARPTAHV